MSIYINEDIFKWNYNKNSFNEATDGWQKSYSYLEHAEALLTIENSPHFMVDIISNLKRAVDFRINQLSKKYKLKELKCLFGAKGSYDLLVMLGVIRPLMLEKLITLRNQVEHQFEIPNNIDLCKELTEFVWYFLKTTDLLTKYEYGDLCFQHPTKKHLFCDIEINFTNKWSFNGSGWLPQEMYSLDKSNNYFSTTSTQSYFGIDQRLKIEQSDSDDNKEYYKELNDSDIWLNDFNFTDTNIKKMLVALYFEKI
ncbi:MULTISPECIES: hypothetical protein [Aliivibrio]|uniref:Uncharacterized protein n=1 Tax=Aliivibrio finisterrensis TaxID=511998 RepID=A0A4Q5KKG2_9GAMM|nr:MULTISPECIES: hypothetical protein [Aliivibrio]MDD9180712.1 hypothetical protein [Aliivibrio sp. A6]RYU46817.1 hypothetical protein ERW57_18930 [Aliivibrio finisterrensis]RYU47784.1 hypothetical protein ERW56_19100 [Aliivibrio finisterrensis]RYU52344.1 hypothetical protein ERW50_19220 [Aliivibrio finisterrensis]RYU78440.1 hypothetical protein ERW55_19235 [Aliivibrio finisterrensis]